MPIYRCASKSDATAPEAAAQFILDDTGGAVQYGSTWPINSAEEMRLAGRSERRPVEDSANNEC